MKTCESECFCEHVHCHPVDVLARTIYGEARGENIAGKEAIACVIINRVKKAKENNNNFWWGNSVDEVCLKPWQFSCWNKNDPNRDKILKISKKDPVFKSCYRIARRGVCGLLKDKTGGATHYHTKNINPKWSLYKVPSAQIGNHFFYNDID
jgi:spore germination cell wall hydrolase CwlJ-like protein